MPNATSSKMSLPLVHGASSTTEAIVTIKYQWPLATQRVLSTQFGAIDASHKANKAKGCVNRGHGGIDIGAPVGTSVLAARDGVVVQSGTARGYGHWVVLRHPDNEQSIYGHVSAVGLPKVGAKVKAGDKIAKIGAREGHTTGPHLHFQINPTGIGACAAVDPLPKLPSK